MGQELVHSKYRLMGKIIMQTLKYTKRFEIKLLEIFLYWQYVVLAVSVEGCATEYYVSGVQKV